jgi:drug/metabolite transporter (DMT)-like permease
MSKNVAFCSPLVAGWLFGLVTVVIWSFWIVTTRQAVTIDLPVAWIGIFRFALPALALLPFWWRHGLLPRGRDKRLVGLMVAGAGAPFFLIVATGMHGTPAGESGILLGGSMPLFVALLSAAVLGERFAPARLAGFALIIAATVAIGGDALLSGDLASRLLVFVGAALWSVFTLAFKRSGLPALAAAGIVAAWSTLILLPLVALVGLDPVLAAGPFVVAGQIFSQGVLSGVVALACYGAAVARLGASRAAVLSALPPALAALIAIPVLGEVPTPVTFIGIVLAAFGVALASGAVTLRIPHRSAADRCPAR